MQRRNVAKAQKKDVYIMYIIHAHSINIYIYFILCKDSR